MKTSLNHIPEWSQDGSTMTTLPAVHQDGGVKYDTGSPTNKTRGRNDIGTWNVKTLRALVKHRQKNDTKSTSVARTNTNMALGFLFTKTS